MKKIIAIFIVLISAFQVNAQDEDKDAQKERIKALKVAYLTQEMNFNDKIAEKFWPIYNQYERDRRNLHEREHVELNNLECITEDDANDLLDEFLAVENEEYKIKKQLFKDLKQIISAKEIIKLYKLEDEFHRKLIKEYRSKKEQKDADSSE
jgi:3-hydroxyacyl-CoA dehydrogenase